ncbi:MAG: hypothetical protein IT204_10760 [Fimbriimonadaceae bacterium]|nr:hypothetical protein [Fimbriimonadaceae bacterium]
MLRRSTTLLLLLLAVTAVCARTLTHKGAGLAIDVPDTWETKTDEDKPDLLTVCAPDNEIVLQIWPTEAEDLDAALEGIKEELGEQFEELELGEEVKEVEINGLKGAVLHGEGVSDGVKLKMLVAVMEADKPVIFLGFGTPENAEKHNEELGKMTGTIRKAPAE